MQRRMLILVLAVVMLVAAFPIGVHAAPTNTSFATATYLYNSQAGDEHNVTGLTADQSQWFKVYAQAGQWLCATLYDMDTGVESIPNDGDDWDLGLYYEHETNKITHSAEYNQTVEYIGYSVPTTGYYYFKVKAEDIQNGTSSSCTF